MLDSAPSMGRVLQAWAIRLGVAGLCATGFYAAFEWLGAGYGPIGLALAAPLLGVLIARPLIDLAERAGQAVRHLALSERSGFRSAFKGHSLHMDEWLDLDDEVDGKNHLCVSLKDLLSATQPHSPTEVTKRLHDITVQIEKRPYVRVEPLCARLSAVDIGGTAVIHDHLLRLSRHLSQQVLAPWLRRQGRRVDADRFGSLDESVFAGRKSTGSD